jgi:phage repressor protein C with HTH and peptisase S24 domain
MDMGERIRECREALKLTQGGLAKLVGVDQSSITLWETGQSEPKSANLSKLAKTLETTPGWLRYGTSTPPVVDSMETAHRFEPMPVPEMPRDLPVYAGVRGGMDGEIIDLSHAVDYTIRPPSLRGIQEAAGVLVTGSSMEPRYMPGEIVICHPRKPLTRDCYVVLVFTDQTGVVKQWIGRDDRVVRVRQLNPKKTLSYPRDKVADVYRIIRGGEE